MSRSENSTKSLTLKEGSKLQKLLIKELKMMKNDEEQDKKKNKKKKIYDATLKFLESMPAYPKNYHKYMNTHYTQRQLNSMQAAHPERFRINMKKGLYPLVSKEYEKYNFSLKNLKSFVNRSLKTLS